MNVIANTNDTIPKRIKKDNSKLFVVVELRNEIPNFLDIVMLCPRVVFITGANRGLGLEFVRQFLKLGNPPDHLFATCRDPERAEVSILCCFAAPRWSEKRNLMDDSIFFRPGSYRPSAKYPL